MREPSETDLRLRAAARQLVAERGLRATSVSALAERAGVARMTVYRRSAGVERVILDALTDDLAAMPRASGENGLATIVAQTHATLSVLRTNPLFRALQDEEPALLVPYAVERFGGVQQALLDRLVTLVENGQRDGSVRCGDARLLAFTLVLALQGFALLRGEQRFDPALVRAEVTLLVNRYLEPRRP